MDTSGRNLAPLGTRSAKLTLIQCNASLEVIHAHLVRAAHGKESGAWVLAFPEWVSRLAVHEEMWTKALALPDTRPEYGDAAAKIRRNLATLTAAIPLTSYSQIELVVSDLFWLANNVLAANLARFCEKRRISFRLALMDEGAVLYSGTRLGVRRTLKSLAKYAYLKLHRFPALLIHPGNADYLHSLCRKVYCLHPNLLQLPPQLEMERIDPVWMSSVYDSQRIPFSLATGSCLYLSQPLYKAVGMDRQAAVVREAKAYLREQGIVNFSYKAHHADLPAWLERLENECGFQPLSLREQLPVELLAPMCQAEVVLGHCTSALLNLRLYGYEGRIISFGLHKLRAAFPDASQLGDYLHAVNTLGHVELVD